MPPIAPPPPGLRLPVAMGPGFDPSLGVPPIPALPIEIAPQPPVPAPREDTGGAVYRAALAHLAQRRFDEALAGLDAFLRDHPRHPYADNALYWRGEIHYARRDYRRAIAELSALVERYPRGNKVPEALLRIALSYEHMGDAARARQVLERLRREHPNSVAAQAAEREDV
jgi:tol-pal system protein YbgF